MGYKTLMYSAEVSGMEDFEDESMSKFERWLNDKMGEKLVSAVAAIGSVLGIVLAFILFFICLFLFSIRQTNGQAELLPIFRVLLRAE